MQWVVLKTIKIIKGRKTYYDAENLILPKVPKAFCMKINDSERVG